MKAMARPALHFALIGAALFAAQRSVPPAEAPAEARIEIGAERVAALRREAVSWLGRPPDARELDALIEAEVGEELLYREALALGVAERDAVVRRRLERNMRFLGADDSEDAADLYAEARSLGMEQTDLVVRRRLVQRMRLAIESAARAEEPSDAELEAYRARHAERFAAPARIRFSHVFFSTARRGDATDADARAALARVESGEREAGLGDALPLAAEQPLQSEREIAKLFGGAFARAVSETPAGAWAGPLRSAYGAHLVLVRERVAETPWPLDAVRARVRDDLLAERAERAVRRAIASLRERYAVHVAGGGEKPGRKVSIQGSTESWRGTVRSGFAMRILSPCTARTSVARACRLHSSP